MHTEEQVAAMKRQELQSAAAQRFGKDASRWLLSATNQELPEALLSGEVPARFAANGNGGDLAAAIATAIQPLIGGRLDEDCVSELIDQRLAATQRTTEVVVRRIVR
jgi:hypothetical protein